MSSVNKDPLIGQQLDEYKLEQLLGRGGMARVYTATDVRLGRQVAIKVIDAPFRAEAEYGTRFMREARAIAQLEHPHIVRLYRYGEVDGLFYIAMQYVEGVDLQDSMTEARRAGTLLPLARVREILAQLCQALDYIHSKGVIHRDIKPSNILIDRQGQVLLTDFGLAMLTSTQTQGEVFGSPHYIAPEQAISSATAVPQSDLYSVGVMLYELVTGRLPFEADNALSVAMMHASEAPPPPRQFQPELSPALESVILRSLAKEPHKRFATGAALLEAFDHALAAPLDVAAVGSLTASKRPLPPVPAAVVADPPRVESAPILPDPAADRRRRRRRARAVLLLLLLIGAGGGWLYTTNTAVRGWANGQLTQIGLLPQPTATATQPPEISAQPTAASTPTTTATSTTPPTAVPSATNVPVVAATDTAVPAATPSPQPTETTAPTATPSPTSTSTPDPTATPSPTPVVIVVRPQDEMPMVLIPAGTFMMGSDTAENEQPIHPVTLTTFYMDQYEVSVGQYAQFLNEAVGVNRYGTGCNGALCLKTQFEGVDSVMTTNTNGHTGQGETENYPVNNIRWHGAQAYCAWVGGRLPTEAEWEYTARGPEGRLYPWGEAEPDETRALFGLDRAAGDTYQANMQPVDAFPEGATPLGVYNLAGGVSEWLADAYTADFYATAPAENPFNSAFNGTYILRGGAWNSTADTLRASYRFPTTQYTDDTGAGFRCAYDFQE